MPNIKYLLCLFVVAAPLGAADIYSWVDEDGERHFSDTPQEGAEQVELSPTNTFTTDTPPPAPVAEVEESTEDEPGEVTYDDFRITSPAEEAVLWNTAGEVAVSMSLTPRLMKGHRLELYLDGARVGSFGGKSLSHTLTGVERGTHSLQGAIVDQSGSQLGVSNLLTFTVQQATIQNQAGF